MLRGLHYLCMCVEGGEDGEGKEEGEGDKEGDKEGEGEVVIIAISNLL